MDLWAIQDSTRESFAIFFVDCYESEVEYAVGLQLHTSEKVGMMPRVTDRVVCANPGFATC